MPPPRAPIVLNLQTRKFHAGPSDCRRFFDIIASAFETRRMPGKFNSPRDFTRSGPLSPDLVTVLILYMVSDAGRRRYAHLLRAFWDEVAAHGIRLPCAEPVNATSFCEARHKITPTFFRELLYQVAAAARPHDDPPGGCGRAAVSSQPTGPSSISSVATSSHMPSACLLAVSVRKPCSAYWWTCARALRSIFKFPVTPPTSASTCVVCLKAWRARMCSSLIGATHPTSCSSTFAKPVSSFSLGSQRATLSKRLHRL